VYVSGDNKVKLLLQHTLVRLVIQDAIENIRASIIFTNAFPDAALSIMFAKSALMSAAKGQLPATQDIYSRLMRDDDYLSSIIPVVCGYDIEDIKG
jgi:hypothetical protein